jgi:hypothetical protein
MEAAEALVRAALDDLNHHDVEGFFARCTEDYTTTNEFGVFSGKDENRALFAAFDGIPDHWRTIERVVVAGTGVVEVRRHGCVDRSGVRDGRLHGLGGAWWPSQVQQQTAIRRRARGPPERGRSRRLLRVVPTLSQAGLSPLPFHQRDIE